MKRRRLIVPIFAALLAVPAAAAQKPADVVRWTAKAPAAAVKPGGTAAIRLDAQIEDGWYIYAMTQPENGPVPLAIAVSKGAALALDSARIAAPVPKIKHDPGFGAETQTYEGKTTFTLPLTAARTARAGAHKVSIEVTSQACNGSICLRPSTIVVPVVIAVR